MSPDPGAPGVTFGGGSSDTSAAFLGVFVPSESLIKPLSLLVWPSSAQPRFLFNLERHRSLMSPTAEGGSSPDGRLATFDEANTVAEVIR